MIRKRNASVLALGLAGVVALPGVSYADNINDTIEGSSSVTIAAGASGTASIKVVSTSNNDGEVGCNIDPGETFTLSFNTPTGVSVPNLTIPTCDTFYPVEISTTSAAQSGTVTANIAVNTTGSGTFNNNVSIPVTITGGGTVTPPANTAPTVSVPAADTNGLEGSALTATGTFADDGGAGNLTISKVSGAGTFTPGVGGAWSWSHTPNDNLSGTVVVRATDTQGLSVEDSFDWQSANVAPEVAVSVGRESACVLSLNASFTDPGTADTHNAVINWGDGTTSNPDGDETSPVTGKHAYAAAGTYTASVTVTDDDGGADTKSAVASAYNTPSVIQAPINSGGTRSSFKIGSTIPVKITVTGCDGAQVGTLTPQVNLVKGDSTPDFPVNEATYTDSATNGKLMRWDATGQQYIYNLSTKLSQFTGAALTAGTYTVAVNDPSFAAPVRATFDLRK